MEVIPGRQGSVDDEAAWDTGRFGPPVGGPDSVLVRVTPVTVVSRDRSYVPAAGLR